MSAPPDSTLAEGELRKLLGRRLRQQRRSLGRTLADVATTADVSSSYLSSIEKGAAVPSLPVLARLAHALEVTLAEVLRGSSTKGVAVGRVDGDKPVEVLTSGASRLEIVRLLGRPGDRGEAPFEVLDGDVFVYVYAGSLAVAVDGEPYELGAGDAIHCAVPERIAWEATGAAVSVSVWVTKAA